MNDFLRIVVGLLLGLTITLIVAQLIVMPGWLAVLVGVCVGFGCVTMTMNFGRRR